MPNGRFERFRGRAVGLVHCPCRSAHLDWFPNVRSRRSIRAGGGDYGVVLRAPGGCPWDREQTFDTIKPYTLEETYEVLEAIDNRDWPELKGELGDLLLQVLFYAEMAKEEGTFSIDDVLDRLASKLVDRHPHVFGDVKADTSGQVLGIGKHSRQKKRGTEAEEKLLRRKSPSLFWLGSLQKHQRS